MRVVVTERCADVPTAIDRATLVESDPPALGPRDVLVKIESAAVGWVDLIMMAGQYQHLPALPYTPGMEYAGTVAASAIVDFAVGDRVMVDPFVAGPRSTSTYRDGGFATHALLPAEAVLRIPGALTFDEAANLLGNYETAYHCLVTRGRVQPGETVLVHGASGSTGLAAVHLAKLLGATVIASGRNRERLAIVKAQGADEVITSDQIASIKNVDVVYDPVGGDLSVQSLRCLRFGGRFLIVGWASTPGAINQLPTNLIMMKGLDVLGCPAVISAVKDPSLRPPRLAKILAWAAAGKIKPHISHAFPLADFKSAMQLKWRGEVIGGCVLNP